jgi:hypothetical protein
LLALAFLPRSAPAPADAAQAGQAPADAEIAGVAPAGGPA